MPDSRDNDDESPLDRFFEWAETVVYVLVGAILIGGALVLLVESIVVFFETLDDGVVAAATETLSILLIVFIFVELLGAVRVIIREQRLIAEPFLLVGIIAAIKEIVVVAGAESPTDGDFAEFRDAMVEIGVLAGIVLLLAIAALLLRKREREPSEETEQPSARSGPRKLRAVVVRLEDWFLTPGERGNDATKIDRRRGDGRSWTEGNHVRVLVHGAEYFTRLYRELCTLERDDWIHFTDWRGDPDELLAGPGTQVAKVLADCARKGVHVRGLVWRSHPDEAHFSEEENLHLVETINEAGGEVLLDERVHHAGSHHQKLFVLRHPDHPDDDVAFIGGIDLCHGRNDDDRHEGDPQAIEIDDRYGERPAWHDVQLEVRGPGVGDLAYTFRERWEDPTPVDHRNPVRARVNRIAHEPKRPDPMPPMPPDPAAVRHARGAGRADVSGPATALSVRAGR